MYKFLKKLKVKFTDKEIDEISDLKRFTKTVNGKTYIVKCDYDRKFFSIKRNMYHLKILNKCLGKNLPNSFVFIMKLKAIFGEHKRKGDNSNKYVWERNKKVTVKRVMLILSRVIKGRDITKKFVKNCKDISLIKGLKCLLKRKLVPDFCTSGNFLKDEKGKCWYVDARWPLFNVKQGEDYRLGREIINRLK